MPWRPVTPAALPLFRRDVDSGSDSYAAFYAPGCLCVVPRAGAGAFEAALSDDAAAGWAGNLRSAAVGARHEARNLADLPFRPECLTLYLNQVCNLRCSYCYANTRADTDAPAAPARGEGRGPAVQATASTTLDLPSIAGAAHLVAANCRERGQRFHVGLHGGGEPLLNVDYAGAVLDLLDGIAAEHGVEPFYYVATNGVVAEKVVHRLARRVHLVGLSCDGPPAIHNLQRPSATGRPTLHVVERTARLLRGAGTRFQVRATITRHSLHRLPEVVDDICRRLAPKAVHIEPVYAGGRSDRDQELASTDAATFVAGYLAARDVALGHGVRLTTSGSRLGAIHGPYCHLFRHVLNLVPGGGEAPRSGGAVATACFKTTTAAQALSRGVAIGALDPASGRFQVDVARADALRARLAEQPAHCAVCVNRCHCAGDCPDVCALDVDREAQAGAGFRCTMLRTLSGALLDARAAGLWAEVRSGIAKAPHGTGDF